MRIFAISPFLKHQVRAMATAATLAVTLVAQGCTPRSSVERSDAIAPSDPQGWNDTARFLSGMKGRPDGPFRRLEDTLAWQSYAARFDADWRQLQTERMRPLAAFQQRELAPVAHTGQYVFYPFSGPDVLYLTGFFPNGKVLVMAGLEPVGSLRVTKRYNAKTLERELSGWRQSVSSIFERSFFVTREMDSEFRGRVADGLLPMLLLLLERSGYSIDAVQYGQLSPSGEFGPEPSADPPIRKHKAVQIRFHRGSESTNRTLYYFSTDLGPAFDKNPAFARFLDGLGTPDTLVKSAQFLLHWGMCSGLRRYILEKSNLILQDDTGIPYSYFLKPGWQVHLYGEYSAPVKPFRHLYQKDLALAFQDPAKVRPLGFSLGYGAGLRPSSMILAIRTQPPVRTASRRD